MRSLLTSAALTVALVVAAPAVSRAQDTEDAEILKMAKEHYRLGTEAFKAGKYPEAIKELKKAYLLKRLPPLLKNIGQTYEKLNDLDNAIYYYKKYLAEAPPDAKDRDQVKQSLEELQQKKAGGGTDQESGESPVAARPGDQGEEAPPPARTKKKPVVEEPAQEEPPPPARTKKKPVVEEPAQEEPPPPARTKKKPVVEEPAQEEPPPPARTKKKPVEGEGEEQPQVATNTRPERSTGGAGAASEWAHTPIDASPPDQCLDVKVQTPVMKGVKVYLYYRGQGEAEFTQVLMKRHGAEKSGRIPARAMTGKSIQYYLEAKDSTGNVVKNAGTQVDPNIVFLDPAAPTQCAGAEEAPEGEEGAEPVAPRPTRPKRSDCDEHPLECQENAGPNPTPGRGQPAGPGGPVFSTLGWVGLGLAAGGLVIGGAGGGTLSYLAYNDAVTVSSDASNKDCRQNLTGNAMYKGQLCYFNNQNDVTPTDYDIQNHGKSLSPWGPVLIGVGGGMMLAGGALMIYDYLKLHPSAPPPAPRKKRRRPAAEAPPAESSLIQDLIIVPTANPQTVGLSAAFRF